MFIDPNPVTVFADLNDGVVMSNKVVSTYDDPVLVWSRLTSNCWHSFSDGLL